MHHRNNYEKPNKEFKIITCINKDSIESPLQQVMEDYVFASVCVNGYFPSGLFLLKLLNTSNGKLWMCFLIVTDNHCDLNQDIYTLISIDP